jgi:hypothetical protein
MGTLQTTTASPGCIDTLQSKADNQTSSMTAFFYQIFYRLKTLLEQTMVKPSC